MVLGEAQTFSSPEEALQHFGVKGMRWGVRKEEISSPDSQVKRETDAERSARRRATAKKVAIGTGALIAVAGAGFVAYQLHKSGNLSLKSLKKAGASSAAKKAVKSSSFKQTKVLHAARGKFKGFRFYQEGGVPNAIDRLEAAFGPDGANVPRDGKYFEHLPGGEIAAAFHDPKGRRDQAGRIIPHNLIIPKSMTSGITSLDDVISKVWPSVAKIYDPQYEERYA